MLSSEMLRRVDFVGPDDSEERIAFILRVTGIYELEDDILHSHRRENLKSYTELKGWAL
jgi:hypothetical protein